MSQLSFSLQKQFLGILLVTSLITNGCGRQETVAQKPRVVPVNFETIKESTLINSSDFVGTLDARQQVNLAPQIEGRIVEIFVTNGDIVNRNMPIIQLEPLKQQEQVNAAVSSVNAQRGALSNAQAQLQVAQAQEQQAQAEVAQSQANLANAEAELKSKDADVISQEADLQLAKINYERSKFLVETGVQPQQNLDDNTRNLDAEKANTEAAKKVRDASKASRDAAKQALNASIKSLEVATKQVKAAQSTISQQAGLLKEAKAQVGVVSQELDYNRVVAPVDGMVGYIPVKVGDFVKVGDTLTTITNNNILDLNLNIPVGRIPQIRMGLPVEIVKSDGSAGITGEITFISPTIDQEAQTILTRATFRNNGSLRDDQFVNVRVIWSKKPGVLIPTASVTRIGGQQFVYVAEAKKSEAGEATQVARQKSVQLGQIQGQEYQVISGVDAGEKLITSGILSLSDGVPIQEASATTTKTTETTTQ